MKYIKLYENRHDFVFDEQRYFPNTALVNGEEEPTYFTDVEEVVFELTVTLPTEKVVTGQTYTLAVEYGGADVFASSTISTTGDVTLNGTQFTANTDGDFSVTATYDGKTVTLNGTSKLMTAAPTIEIGGGNTQYGRFTINVIGQGTKTMTFNGEEYTSNEVIFSKIYYEDLTEQTVVATATAQENGKWESDTVTKTFVVPVAAPLTATISDDTLEDGQTAQITVMYGSYDVTNIPYERTRYTASGDVTCTEEGVVTAAYSTGSGSIVVNYNNLPPITINVTVTEAVPVSPKIVFTDPDVKTIVANAYGSDGEITEEQAAAVTTWFSGADSSNPFYKNANVDSFDEFGTYFTSVTEIGTAAFYGCRNMTSITIPENVTSIRERAFDYCYLLGSITIPDSVTYIGRSAFQACTGLTTLNLGSYVETIDIYAFKECSSLTSVNIPDSVTTLGEEAFNSCTNLNTVTIGKSLSAIKYTTIPIPSAAIPTTISYVSVSSQNNTYDSRDNCNGIIETATNKLILGCKNTVIPSTVTYIGVSAFSGCTGLTSITIPSTVTAIGNYGFNGCTGLTSVTIGNSVTSIGSFAFRGCTGLTSVTIPANVTSIGDSAFYGCTGLTSVTIGNSVTSIGGSAFNRCTSIQGITIPASVTEIGGSAFRNCSGLTSITCEATTPPTLGSFVFDSTNDCPILVPAASVDAYKAAHNWSIYASRIQAIGGGEPVSPNIVFADPDVKAIVANAYGSNGEITEAQAAAVITFMSGTDSSNGFYGNTNINSFDEFRYFTSVSEIGDNTFENCSNMTSIIIPSSVTSIGNRAVRGCRSLTRVICEATVPPTLGNGVFGTTNGCPLYVPEESLDGYKTAPNWSTYASRIQAIGVTVSLPTENIVTGYKYNLNVTYNGGDVLSNATITSTGDVTISGSSFTANSDGAFSITATYNGYTATLNGTAYTPQYAVAVLDCSRLEDANPLKECFNGYYDEELEEDVVYQEPRIDCTFSGNVAVESGVITMSDDSTFDWFSVDASADSIGYIKLTHPSADYKVDTRYVDFNGGMYDYEAVTVTFDSATLTTTISNFVPYEGFDDTFDGSDFNMKFNSYGNNPIKITRIEVGYATPSE